MESTRRVWKVRTIKDYPEAHNHLLLGELLEQTPAAVRLRCRTFHFGRMVNGVKDIRVGEIMVRLVPWGRIEIINELPASFGYERARLVAAADGSLGLQDEDMFVPLVKRVDDRSF